MSSTDNNPHLKLVVDNPQLVPEQDTDEISLWNASFNDWQNLDPAKLEPR